MSILADLSGLEREVREMLVALRDLAREVREMLVALRDLAREMRDPAPKPHPLDASPLPTPEEAFKGADEEAREWAKMQEQVAEWLKTPPESSAPTAPTSPAAPEGGPAFGDSAP